MSDDRPGSKEVTRTLHAAALGDSLAARELLPLVYEELRKLARSKLARLPPGQTLQATELVHEAYLRVVGAADPGWNGRGHFFGAAARAMQQVLVEQARRKATAKRGGAFAHQNLECMTIETCAPNDDLLELHEALGKLASEDARAHEIVLLRFFLGLTAEEAAAALGLSLRTAEREWRYARAWLRAELQVARGGAAHDS